MNIAPVRSYAELAAVRALFSEYAESLGVDLSYQGFDAELAGLPGMYAPPWGRLYVATEEGHWAGCVALRPRDDLNAEMKRLFVLPAFQGRGIGRALAEEVIKEARSIGYRSLVLDTLPTMAGAIYLYESLGFVRRAPYYESPIPGNLFMELRLRLDA